MSPSPVRRRDVTGVFTLDEKLAGMAPCVAYFPVMPDQGAVQHRCNGFRRSHRVTRPSRKNVTPTSLPERWAPNLIESLIMQGGTGGGHAQRRTDAAPSTGIRW